MTVGFICICVPLKLYIILFAHIIAQLEFAMLNYSVSLDAIQVSYDCWTNYATPIGITLTDGDGFVHQTICLNDQTITLSNGSNRCGEFSLCGFFNFVNDTILADCSLNCSNSVRIPCPPDPLPCRLCMCMMFTTILTMIVSEPQMPSFQLCLES